MTKSHAEERQAEALEPNDLFGEFRFKVDSKGRLALPAKFRKVLSKDLVVTRELTDECIYVFEEPAFNDWVMELFEDKFGGYKASNREHVKLRRKIRGHADSVEVDSSGRIMLKPEMREKTGISKEVLVVGNGDHFEIWDAQTYDRMDEDVDLAVFYDD